MKLELPLALGLLALGCWLFLPGAGSGFTPEKPDSTASSPVDQASFDEVVTGPENSPVQPSPNTALPSSASPLQNQEAQEFVQLAAANLSNGPAIQAKSRLGVKLFSQSLTAEGQYFQSGQGRGKTRFDFHLTAGASEIRLSQISDGRFFFLESERDGETELSFADLERIGQAATTQIDFAGNPSSWLGVGGLVGMLEQLGRSFDFQAPEQVVLGGIPMTKLRGTWKLAQLRKILQYNVDPKWIEPEPVWDKIPPQIPDAVELHFGNDQFLPLFPYRISFFRTEIRDEQEVQVPTVVLEMYEVSKLERIDDQVFFVNTDGRNPKDITYRWSSRLDQFRKLADAESTADPSTIRK